MMASEPMERDPAWTPRAGDRVGALEVMVVDSAGVAWRDHVNGWSARAGRETWRRTATAERKRVSGLFGD